MRTINQLFTSTALTLLFCFVAPSYTMGSDFGADNESKEGEEDGYDCDQIDWEIDRIRTGEYQRSWLEACKNYTVRVEAEIRAAIETGDTKLVSTVLEKEKWLVDGVKKPLLNKLLFETLTNNQCDIARTLLVHTADPNHHIPSQPFSTGPGKTILMEMAEKGTPEAVTCLLDAKADPKVRSWGTAIPMNAFEWSMHNDQHFLALAQLFIAREASPTGLGSILYDLRFPHSWERKTPLLIQAMNINNRSPLIALFLDNHANPFTTDLNSDHTNALDTVCLRTHTYPPYYTKECPFKLALLLYTHGLTPNTQKLKKYFPPQQIAFMKSERARRIADGEYITTFYTVEKQVSQPFKVSYNNALLLTLLQTFSRAPEALVNIIASYAEYHPELADYSRNTYPENYDPAPTDLAPKKKKLKECVIQ